MRIAHWIHVAGASVAGQLFERGRVATARPTAFAADVSADSLVRKYQPSSWFRMLRALRAVRLGHDDVVVDFGSGMGRVVCHIARRFPVKRVVGVELDPQLSDVAERNVEALRGTLRARDVELVTGDVREFPIPDDMTCAYLYNPFDGQVFRDVLASIIASLDRRPRALTLVYVHPKMGDAIISSGRFRETRSMTPICGPRTLDRCIKIYTSCPERDPRR